jgi:hypothetical protein
MVSLNCTLMKILLAALTVQTKQICSAILQTIKEHWRIKIFLRYSKSEFREQLADCTQYPKFQHHILLLTFTSIVVSDCTKDFLYILKIISWNCAELSMSRINRSKFVRLICRRRSNSGSCRLASPTDKPPMLSLMQQQLPASECYSLVHEYTEI